MESGKSRIPNETGLIANASNARTIRSLLRDLGSLFEFADEDRFGEALLEVLGRWLPNVSASLWEFEKNLQPRLIACTGNDSDSGMVQYLSGLYLLDPFYELFSQHNRFGVFGLDLKTDGDLEFGDAFKRYWIAVNGIFEVGVNIEIAPGLCIHLSLYISDDREQSQETALAFLRQLEPCLVNICRTRFGQDLQAHANTDSLRREVHKAVSTRLHEFGSNLLTEREREIVQLLLKGHSTKSLARILDITPGTASIHRSNIYKKLDVPGQGELFGLFLTQLGQ